MHFFKHFQKMEYAFIDSPEDKKEVVNILTAFFLKKIQYQRSLAFQQYVVRDSDIPESLSNDLYKTPMYYWALLLINDVVNPYYDWMMSSETLDEFVAKKYKDGVKKKLNNGSYATVPASSGKGGIHHFFDVITNRVCDEVDDEYYRTLWLQDPLSIGQNIIPVTNTAYEKDINFEKRKIFIINPKHILDFEEDFSNVVKKHVSD